MQNEIAADPAAIRRDLEHMTRHWHELPGRPLLEIRTLGESVQPVANLFPLDWLDDAVDCCVNMNKLKRNVYAVRNPIREGTTRSASDADIIAARYLWADCDDATASANMLSFVGPKWTWATVTGTVPFTRAHTYWELTEWCHDLAAWRDQQIAIAAHFKSDPSVINPSRIMRVAGCVSWPNAKKREKGYVAELATMRTDYPDNRAPMPFEQMQRAFAGAQQSLSAQAMPQAPQPGRFEIDTGPTIAPLDRERLAVQALSGDAWHNAVIRLVASYVAKGLNDGEIHDLTQQLTLAGYTAQDTAKEVQTAIDGARRKGWAPEQYASPAALQIAPQTPDAQFDAPKRPSNLEWFDDAQPALGGAYIVKSVLDAGSMSVVYGPSNSGKTFFAFDLAYHVAIGAVWRNCRVTQTAVLYLAAEGGNGAMNRMAALKQEHGVCEVPFALKRAGLDLLHDQADLQHIADLAREVTSLHPGKPLLIVIDTLSRIMAGGDENSAADMTALIRNIDAIREATGAHIMLVHHTGKDTARGARGHSSLRAATDTEIEVSNEGGARAAMVTKQRDHQGGETFAFALKSVILGTDTDGDDVTSCVIEPVDSEEHAAKTAAKGRGKNQQIIMQAFDQMKSEGLAFGNAGGTGMPDPGKFWAVDVGELRRISQGKMVGENAAKLFRSAWDALTASDGVFGVGNNQAWRIDRRKS
jgi:hypothetical protein